MQLFTAKIVFAAIILSAARFGGFILSLKKKFFHFAAPSIISMWIFSLYTMVDGIFVAWGCGETALAAVNLASPFTIFIFAIGLVFATGTSTVTAMLLGQGKPREASSIFTQNVVLLAIISIFITILGVVFAEPIAHFLGATPSTLPYVKSYLTGIASFAGFFIVSYNMEVLVKTDGTPQVSAVGVISCGLTNVLLDYLFVIRFGWGVLGAAVATGIAQVVSTIIFFIYFTRKAKKLRFCRFPIDLGIYKRIVPIGLADGITELSGGLVIFLFNLTILRVIGESGVVSYTVISYVNTLVLMTMTGTTQGMQPLVSYHFGKGETASCKLLLRYALTTVGVAAVAIFALVQVGAEVIVSLFIRRESAEIFAYTAQALRLFSISFLMMGINVVMAGYFAAIERPRYSFTISLARSLVLLVLCLSVLAAVFGDSGIWVATGASEFLCLLITITFFVLYQKKMHALPKS